ncbi:MAG: hypothetical protein TREMPRED_002792, partial [Tremellales sp. Tagirdzhanova-0007]
SVSESELAQMEQICEAFRKSWIECKGKFGSLTDEDPNAIFDKVEAQAQYGENLVNEYKENLLQLTKSLSKISQGLSGLTQPFKSTRLNLSFLPDDLGEHDKQRAAALKAKIEWSERFAEIMNTRTNSAINSLMRGSPELFSTSSFISTSGSPSVK